MSWQALAKLGIGAFVQQLAIDLGRSRESRLSPDEAIAALRRFLIKEELQ